MHSLRSVLLVLLCCTSVSAAETAPLKAYQRDVAPVLKRYCFACHGEKKQEASLRLDTLNPDLIQGKDAETWHDVLNRLNLGDMPPKKATQPELRERKILVDWITDELRRAEELSRSTGGRVVMRRLTRYEYNNTMRDLLGIDLDFAVNLPPDSLSADGFQNNGDVLTISPIQMEYYLKAARLALDKVIVTGPAPEVVTHRAEKSEKVRRVKGMVSNELTPGSRFLMRMDKFPREGLVRVRVRAKAVIPPNAGSPRLRVELGVRADVQAPAKTLGEVDVSSDQFQTYEFLGRIEEFPLPGHNPKYPGLQVTIANADGENPGTKKRRKKNEPADPTQPVIVVESAEFEGPVFGSWPPSTHTRIFINSPKREDESEYAAEVLRRFMHRAYRRPVTDSDVAPMLFLYEKLRPKSSSFEHAMGDVLAMVLVSPEFLYLVERRESSSEKQPLSDYELASRLSFFLWSTMPDERLVQLASQQKLRDPKVLQSEVKRLVNDPQAWEFVEHFTDQWLDLSGVDRVAVNPEYYPNFDERLKGDMRNETLHFFGEILQKDLSALNLLESDFTMLNRRLAKHYGIPGPSGSDFERVSLPGDANRGGLLTQGSFLLRNSNGEDSHPIKRAVWLLDRLLDAPPAPPPPDVPDLDPTQPDLAKLTLKEQLEVHRQKVSCNNCHRQIDPWGVAFENYDAIGQWRTVVRGPRRSKKTTRVDATVTLPERKQVVGAHGIKQHLAENRKEEFARALVKRVLTYSLGRTMELGDRNTIDQLTSEFIQNDYRLQSLIQSLVISEPFLTK